VPKLSPTQVESIECQRIISSLLLDSYHGGRQGADFSLCQEVAWETNSFHLPKGEMTITLDDVSFVKIYG